MSLHSELESEYSYVTDESADTIDELLKRFTLKASPQYAFKLRDQCCDALVVGADFTCDSGLEDPSLALVVKPVDRHQWWRRVRVNHKADISLRSRKLKWWVFTLDLEADLNPVRRTRDLSFRVATAWDVAGGKYQKKSRFHPCDGASVAVHWNVSYDLPEMKGRFRNSGESGDSEGLNDMEASLGYAHGEITKLELSVWPRSLMGSGSKKKDELKSILTEDGRTRNKGVGSMIDSFVSSLKNLPGSQAVDRSCG